MAGGMVRDGPCSGIPYALKLYVAIENDAFIVDLLIKNSDFP